MNDRLIIRQGKQMGKQTVSAREFVNFMKLMALGQTVAVQGVGGMKIFKLTELRNNDGSIEKFEEKKDNDK